MSEISKEEISDAIKEFMARGGEIKVLKPAKNEERLVNIKGGKKLYKDRMTHHPDDFKN